MQFKEKSEYPIFSFRLAHDEKEWLENELQELKKLINRSRPDDARVIKKNEIIMYALKMGLEAIRHEHRKK